MYYNPDRGQFYHSQETCKCARPSVRFKPLPYGKLEEGDFAKLKRCDYCAAPLRASEIAEINALYAPGGDHDPVLTEARLTCPRAYVKR